MDNKIASPSALHPMLWVAAISVTLLSLAGIASLTGLLPPMHTPAAVSTAVPADTASPAVSSVKPAVPELPVAAKAPEAKPAVVQHKPAKRSVVAHNEARPAAALPPPAGAGVPPDYVTSRPVSAAAPACANCGLVSGVRQVSREGQGSGLGAVAGGVLGGVLGNQVGNGSGRTLATIAGAVGGGLLGNRVEKTQRESIVYQTSVRMDDGSTQVIETGSAPSWRNGDPVRLIDGAIVPR